MTENTNFHIHLYVGCVYCAYTFGFFLASDRRPKANIIERYFMIPGAIVCFLWMICSTFFCSLYVFGCVFYHRTCSHRKCVNVTIEPKLNLNELKSLFVHMLAFFIILGTRHCRRCHCRRCRFFLRLLLLP